MRRLAVLFILLLCTSTVSAKPNYEKTLNEWTRSDRVYVWENFEARAIWHAVYLSPEFREARRQQLIELYGADSIPYQNQVRRDRDEAGQDMFYVAVYSGSSQWPDLGKDTANWRFLLETGKASSVDAKSFERVPVTPIDRSLYPFLDKWSHAYLLTFPKTIQIGNEFRLKMAGVPAKSELTWVRSN